MSAQVKRAGLALAALEGFLRTGNLPGQDSLELGAMAGFVVGRAVAHSAYFVLVLPRVQ